jgi:hypothetical protein
VRDRFVALVVELGGMSAGLIFFPGTEESGVAKDWGRFRFSLPDDDDPCSCAVLAYGKIDFYKAESSEIKVE